MLVHSSAPDRHFSRRDARGALHGSMRNLDQVRPACKQAVRGLRPLRKQAPALNGNPFIF
jgi:hypothetical protein